MENPNQKFSAGEDLSNKWSEIADDSKSWGSNTEVEQYNISEQNPGDSINLKNPDTDDLDNLGKNINSEANLNGNLEAENNASSKKDVEASNFEKGSEVSNFEGNLHAILESFDSFEKEQENLKNESLGELEDDLEFERGLPPAKQEIQGKLDKILKPKQVENRPIETTDEKAKRLGLYQNEKGEWFIQFGKEPSKFDDRADEFELDIKSPKLGNTIDRLSEKYSIGPGGASMVRKEILERPEAFADKNEEYYDNLFRAIRISGYGNKAIMQYSGEDLAKLANTEVKFYETIQNELGDNEQLKIRHIPKIAGDIAKYFDPNLFTDEFVVEIAKLSLESDRDRINGYKRLRLAEELISGMSKNHSDSKLAKDAIGYVDELIKDEGKITEYSTAYDILVRYIRQHGLKNDTIEGFKENIIPLVEQNDPEVEALTNGGNIYGTGDGEYGIGDYIDECLTSRVNPENIDRLVRINREIPTSDFSKFEQNRKDAIRLQGTIIGGRDFIHDERPGAHEVLEAIEEYYDSRDDKSAHEVATEKLNELEEKYHFDILPNALNIEAYEKPVAYMAYFQHASEGSSDERAIDILRRLVKNTTPDLLTAPKTKDEELNQLLQNINPQLNEQNGEVRLNIKDVGPAIVRINQLLEENQNTLGIFPSTISAVAYLDKMSAYALRELDKKQTQEIIFDPSFKEIVRFSQLTSSDGYDEPKFESQYNKILKEVSFAYSENGVDGSKISEALKDLSQMILKNADALAKTYKEEGKTQSGSIWSGNLSHELIGLFEKA